MQFIVYAALAVLFLAAFGEASRQRYVVHGTIRCGNRPSPGNETSLKLINKNVGPDSNMGKVKTSFDGSFRIDGTSSELIGNIDPELHVYTDCNDGLPCQRKIKYTLPKTYIDNPSGYDFGTVNVEAKVHDEGRDCWH